MLSRRWSKEAVLILTLSMPVEEMQANPNVRNDLGKVAIQRGPLVYCLEEVDNGANLPAISLAKDPDFTVKKEEILDGILSISAKGVREEEAGWEDALYLPYSSVITSYSIHYTKLYELRKLAKTLVKKIPGEDGIFQYLELAKDQSFEEIMLQGFVIGYSDLTDDRMYKAVEVFLPRIDNWSVCDSFCTTIKRFPKDRKRCFAFLLDCLGRAEERTYDRRFAIVMMLLYS